MGRWRPKWLRRTNPVRSRVRAHACVCEYNGVCAYARPCVLAHAHAQRAFGARGEVPNKKKQLHLKWRQRPHGGVKARAHALERRPETVQYQNIAGPVHGAATILVATGWSLRSVRSYILHQ
jgi:hypothetical protein